ncbi:MAG: class I adenylate-forming enzyme family protein [Acutalibacteraceae bacterium]|nr:class I adenylate-forming enzyme family protein [Acutalibacteraceae bacterium]
MNLTCYDYLKVCAKKTGDFNAVVAFGSKIKLSRLIRDIDALAAYFNTIGIGKGDSVTIFLPNVVHAFTTFYSLNKIGVIANIVHPLTSPEALKESIDSTKSKAIFILDILAAKYASALNETGIPCIICSNSDYIMAPVAPAFKVFEKVKGKGLENYANAVKYSKAVSIGSGKSSVDYHDGSQIAVYLHGGGTTGKSKTIMLTSNNLNNLSEKLNTLDVPHRAGDEYSLMVLPIFHAFGLGIAMHFPLTHGFTSIPMPQFDAKTAVKHLKKNKVTFLLGVPNMYKKMMEEEGFDGPHLKNLRLVFCGGDVLPERLVKEFNKTVAKNGGKGKLFRGYGLTEVSSVCTVNTYEHCREDSIGKPLGDIVVQIWDEKRKEVPAGTTGEIVVCGDTAMLGYFNGDNTVKNEGVYVAPDGKRWVMTGDLGYKDSDGFIYFTGRKKRMIIISGYNVYPIDIENAVLQLPFVSEVCAVQGYLKNKPCVKLCVTLNQMMDKNDAIDKIQAYCKKNLAKFSCPRKIEIMDSFPRTKMAKIDFMKLSDTFDPKAK